MIGLTLKKTKLFDTFANVINVSGRNDKKAALAKASDKEKVLLELALNPYKQFHITSWGQTINMGVFTDDEAYEKFIELIEFAQKTNRCSALVERVQNFMLNCNEFQAFWFGRVLEKDLRMGLLEKSVNEVFGDGFVPGMDVMLADKIQDVKRPTFSLKNCIVERKYDGFRCVVIYRYDGIVDVIGRSGKPIENEAFRARLEENKHNLIGKVLDGEAFCPSISFETLSSVLRTADAPLLPDFRMYLFDTMSIEEWDARVCSTPYIDRIKRREEVAQLSTFLYPIEHYSIAVHDEEEGKELVYRLYESFLNEGYEGAMVKDPLSPYQWKRSKSFLKVKPEEHTDAVVTGYYEGENDIAGMLGGFTCDLEDGTDIRVGGGYKLWQRKEFWVSPEQYVGQWIRMKYTMKTADGKLRHPVFKGFRDKK